MALKINGVTVVDDSKNASVAALSATSPSTINVNSADAALKITQLGTGNVLVVEDQSTDSTPFIIDGSGNVTIAGDLTVNGTTTTVNSTTLQVDDINIELGTVATPTDVTAEGGGITLKGTTNKTLNWTSASGSWTSSENINVATGKTYKIAGTDVLSATTLGSGVTSSSLTSLGTLSALNVTGTATVNGTGVITANSASDALRITQVGAGNALVVEDSGNPDSTPFVIDTNGNVGIGVASSGFPLEIYRTSTAAIRLDGDGVGSTIQARSFVDIADAGPVLNFARYRGTKTSPTIVQSGDLLAQFRGGGYDGVNAAPAQAANIEVRVDGTPGTNDMPGRLVFSTTADGASSPTERMRIDNVGRVGIGGAPYAGVGFGMFKAVTGATTSFQSIANYTINSDVTSTAYSYYSYPTTQASAFTLQVLRHYGAYQQPFGAGSTVTQQVGFFVDPTLTGATNNYGFLSSIASGTGRWNFYAAGTADNYFAGKVGIGINTPAVSLEVVGTDAVRVPVGTTAERPTGAQGYLRFNTTTTKYEGYNGSAWTSVGGGATGAGSDAVFIENDQTVTADYTITAGKNAGTFGPVTINTNVTVTVPNGSVWTIV